MPSVDEATDVIRWIDTDVMLVDPMTKVMRDEYLRMALDTNIWNVKQPLESVIKKRIKQIQRRKTPMEEEETEEA